MNHLYILNLYYHLYNVNTTSCYKKMCSTKTQISLINIQVWRLFSTPLMRVTHLTQRHWSNPILTLAHLFMTKCYSLENVFDDVPSDPFDESGGERSSVKSNLSLNLVIGFHVLVCGPLSQVCPRHSCTLIVIWLDLIPFLVNQVNRGRKALNVKFKSSHLLHASEQRQ